MPDEKTRWDVGHLQKENKQQNKTISEHDSRIRELESFRDSTIEKLITIFKSIDEIREESLWLRRVFTSSLIGGVITAAISLIVWLIQNQI